MLLSHVMLYESCIWIDHFGNQTHRAFRHSCTGYMNLSNKAKSAFAHSDNIMHRSDSACSDCNPTAWVRLTCSNVDVRSDLVSISALCWFQKPLLHHLVQVPVRADMGLA